MRQNKNTHNRQTSPHPTKARQPHTHKRNANLRPKFSTIQIVLCNKTNCCSCSRFFSPPLPPITLTRALFLFLTVEGVLLEDALDVALLLPQLALAGAGGQELLLQPLALELLGVGGAGPRRLEAAVEAAPRGAPYARRRRQTQP